MQMASKLKPASRLLCAQKLDVWSIFTPAAMPPTAINLGQGFMNWAPPPSIQAAASSALTAVAPNHYSHPRGRQRLLDAISGFFSPSFNRTLKNTEMVVTAGANEGMYAALLAFLNPGDEVVFIQPFFDQYSSAVTFHGGVPVYVPLRPASFSSASATSSPDTESNGNKDKNSNSTSNISASEWKLDIQELRAAMTPRTKAIIINSPHNPVGKVFSRQELTEIAEVVAEHDLLVLSDEVYEQLVYAPNVHIRFATLPGMWERTLSVFSAGKSFACTGWRVGWLVGPEKLVTPTLAASTRIVFCTNSPLQEAVAAGLEQAQTNGFFEKQREEYQARGKILMAAFDDAGLSYTVPQGGYFVLVDMSRLIIPDDYLFPDVLEGRGRDFKQCYYLAHEIGIVSIPPSEFYCEKDVALGEQWARFAFCKDEATLHEAAKRIKNISKLLKPVA